MPGFGSFIKKIEGEVDVDGVREKETTGLRIGDLSDRPDGNGTWYSMPTMAVLDESDSITSGRRTSSDYEMGLHDRTVNLHDIHRAIRNEERRQQRRINSQSEQQSGVRSDARHGRVRPEHSDGDASESPTIPAGLGTSW